MLEERTIMDYREVVKGNLAMRLYAIIHTVQHKLSCFLSER